MEDTKRSSFRELSFVLTQANCWKLQRTVKRKCNKRILSISNLQISIHFLFSLLLSRENEMLVLWHKLTTRYLNRNYCCFFMLKSAFVSKRVDVKNWWRFDKKSTCFFWDEKICWFCWDEHDIYMTITKAQLLSFDSLNTYLRNFVTLIYFKIFLPYKQTLPVMCCCFLSLNF